LSDKYYGFPVLVLKLVFAEFPILGDEIIHDTAIVYSPT
jgi:hypothetical protein